MVCLICTPEVQGPQARGLRVYISGNSIVFIGKVVGIDCGFSLIGNFQCITFIIKDTHFDGIISALLSIII